MAIAGVDGTLVERGIFECFAGKDRWDRFDELDVLRLALLHLLRETGVRVIGGMDWVDRMEQEISLSSSFS